MPDSIASLSKLLEAAGRFARAKKEDTFFTVGGRGYYENPTSDLLAYFMTPNEHGLHRAFLSAFLECMGLDDEGKKMLESVEKIEREKLTAGGNRIDLIIHGKDWMVIIENKIRHWVANPLDEYVACAQTIGVAKKRYFAILSPSGYSPDHELWRPVTYRRFVDALKIRLNQSDANNVRCKWHYLANEFVLHLDQEICQNHMNEQEIEFVEANYGPIEELRSLSDRYQQFLAAELRTRLEQLAIPSLDLSWRSWGFWVDGENRKEWDFVLISPAQSGGPVFTVKVRCSYPEPLAERLAETHLQDFIPAGMEEGRHVFTKEVARRDEAINELCRVMLLFSGPPGQRIAVDDAGALVC